MMAADLPAHAVMHGPPVPPRMAARRICDRMIGGGYTPEALHEYTDADGTPAYWRIRARLPDGSKWIRPMRCDGMIYAIGEPEFGERGKPIYRLHEIVGADRSAAVWYVEGEKCADAIARLGLIATTAGGAPSDEHADFAPLAGRHVIVWPDNDDAGRAHGDRVAAKLRALGCRVEIVEIEPLALPKGGDVVDYLAAHPGATAADLMALARGSVGDAAAAPLAAAPSEPEALLVSAATVKPEPILWLWPGWLAAGKLHILAGAPGTGKTTIALDLAATITIGGRWPDGSPSPAGDVLMWSSEDGFADTIVPRLIAAGAERSRFRFIAGVRDAEGTRPFDPAYDTPALRRALAAIAEPRLLIVDPIVSAVAGDGNKSNDVRRALQPLVDLAAEYGCAVLGITHHSKNTQGADPVERVTGSIAFGALARLAFATAKMPDGEDGPSRIFTRAKSNIGPDGGGYRYGLAQADVLADSSIRASRVEWGEALEGTARELLAEAEIAGEDTAEERKDAVDWLRDLLMAGPLAADEVQRQAERDGFKWRTVQRAKKKAGAVSERDGFGPGAKYVWRLAMHATEVPCMPCVPSSESGTHGTHGAHEPDSAPAAEVF